MGSGGSAQRDQATRGTFAAYSYCASFVEGHVGSVEYLWVNIYLENASGSV